MVVLVTGGSGYIGSLLIRVLPFSKKYSGETVRILDNMMGNKYYSLFNLPDARYEFVLGDIRNPEDLRKALKDVSVVFDLAGLTSVPLSFKKEKETLEVNVEGAKRLLDVAARSSVEHIVYSSSAAVYGNVQGMVSEEHSCSPASPYARSKLMAERLYLEFYERQGLPATVLRLGTVYGFSPGARFDTVFNKFVFLACIGEPLTVWRGAEKAMRPYLHVKDAVDAFIYLSGLKNSVGEVFNVASVNALLSEVIDAVRGEIPSTAVRFVEAEYRSQVSYGLKIDKLKSYGFTPSRDLRDGVRELKNVFGSFLKDR